VTHQARRIACAALCRLAAAGTLAAGGGSLAGPPPQTRPSQVQPQVQSPSPARPASRAARAPEPAAASPAPAHASPSPATQPASSGVRSEIGQTPIRRDVARAESARPTTAPSAGTQNIPGFDFAKVTGALAIVLGLIFSLRWLLRRSMNPAALPGATNVVQLLTRSALTPRQHLLLVRVGRRLLVVADCNGQLNSLSEITDADEVATLIGQLRDEKLTSASKCFGNLLGMWRRGSDDDAEDAEQSVADGEPFPRAAPDVPARFARDGAAGDDDDASVATARSEISGLMERVRLMSQQFKEP